MKEDCLAIQKKGIIPIFNSNKYHLSNSIMRGFGVLGFLGLMDRGFVYANTHIRGGQEMGGSWYDEGKMMNKKNSFYDFIDCM